MDGEACNATLSMLALTRNLRMCRMDRRCNHHDEDTESAALTVLESAALASLSSMRSSRAACGCDTERARDGRA